MSLLLLFNFASFSLTAQKRRQGWLPDGTDSEMEFSIQEFQPHWKPQPVLRGVAKLDDPPFIPGWGREAKPLYSDWDQSLDVSCSGNGHSFQRGALLSRGGPRKEIGRHADVLRQPCAQQLEESVRHSGRGIQVVHLSVQHRP